ncbi:MAG TPA: tripartite tricarboxylate transporter substrate-binding protein [Geminicoccaceae bacterium]|nr:tripartite tricarboxylate transporter substrate-binding protein [Geminicoccaceae bacterium]
MMLRKAVMATAIVVAGLAVSGFTPQNVECIAPANPGGGWDFTCRSVSNLLSDLGLAPGTVRVTNMPGGVGATAYGHVLSKRAEDPNVLVATSTVGVTQIAQNRYPADADVMRWLGMLGADVGVVLVRPDSPYASLADLLNEVKGDPASVVFGGSSGVGGWDHLRLLMLAQAAGVPSGDLGRIRWVQYEGGTDAVTQMLGGFLDVVSTDLGEIAGFVDAGQIEALAVMSDEPLPGKYEAMPTARSQGYDVTGYNWRGFYVGGGVPDEAYDYWVDALQRLYESEEWQTLAVEHGLTPIWRGGEEFESFVRDQVAQMRQISKDIGVIR